MFQENVSMDTLKKQNFKQMVLGDFMDYGDYDSEEENPFEKPKKKTIE